VAGLTRPLLKGEKMNGKQLRRRRLRKGLGRQELARLSGISAGEIAKAETGALKLRSSQSARLSAALNK
jgi:transcriptional regulator with XRE-family HTH domain